MKAKPLLEISRREQLTPPPGMNIKLEPTSTDWKKVKSSSFESREFKRERSAPIITNRLPIAMATARQPTEDQRPPTHVQVRRRPRKPVG